jgi:hypothetical protein
MPCALYQSPLFNLFSMLSVLSDDGRGYTQDAEYRRDWAWRPWTRYSCSTCHLSAPQRRVQTVLTHTFVWADRTRVVPSTPSSFRTTSCKNLLQLSIPPGGSAFPPLSCTNDFRLAPMYGAPHSRLWEHRKQSVPEFYLPSRLPSSFPAIHFADTGKD